MKEEQDNRTWYQETFDEVHASEHLLRKVEAMRNEPITLQRTLSKGMIAAAAFGVLVFSNVITYAASGSPWILTITLPDGETRQVEMDTTVDGEQIFEYEDVTGTGVSVSMSSAEADVVLDASEEETVHRLEESGDHLYLILDEDNRVDITEGLRNGSCKGTLDTDEGIWYYEVTGTLESYETEVYFVTYRGE